MPYFYILESQRNKSYYIGNCDDIKRRVETHNRGDVNSTKRYIPWKLIYYKKYETLKDARKREKQVKSWKSRKSIQNLIIEDPR